MFFFCRLIPRKQRREGEYHPTFRVRSVARARPTTFQKLCLHFPPEGDGDGSSVTSKASPQKVFHILGILRAFFNPTQALGFLFSVSVVGGESVYTLKIGSKTRLSVDPFSLKPSKKKCNFRYQIPTNSVCLHCCVGLMEGRKESRMWGGARRDVCSLQNLHHAPQP